MNAQPGQPNVETIIAFDTDAMLKKITVGDGVRVLRLNNNTLEVRIAPFAEHGNMWPAITFGPDFFGEPINLAGSSQLEVVLEHVTEGMSLIDLMIATQPDTSKNVDYEQLWIPGQTTMTGKLSMNTLLNNDPSEIALFLIMFRPRAIETVYRVHPVRAVYDPISGSPEKNLLHRAALARNRLSELKRDLTSGLSPEQLEAARLRIMGLSKNMEALTRKINTAQSQQFYKAYRALSKEVDEIIGEIGQLRFISAGPLLIWESDRYPSFLRDTGPDLQTQLVEMVAIGMANNEFRDYVFSVTAVEDDLALDIEIRPVGESPLPLRSVDIRRAEYLKNSRGEHTGDALVPVDGSVDLPAGESRQFWVRFNTRTEDLSPNSYKFELVIRDDEKGIYQAIPGTLDIWDFTLPSYDILPNNSYAIFNYGVREDLSGDKFRQAIKEMKAYGLNYVFVKPPEIPIPTGLDDQWQITGYDDAAFIHRLNTSLEAWRQAPGDGKLNFIIALFNFEDLGLEKEGYAFPNEQWKLVLAQYIDHLKLLIAEEGLVDGQWMLVLRDESGEPALIKYDIPMAEAIKSIDPSIRLTSNSSAIISDPQWTARYFKTFDIFQPHRGRDQVLQWLRESGKPIWMYECDTNMTSLGRDLYDYYRLYTWDMLDSGVVGTGLWTFYSSSHDRPWGEDFQGCQMIYQHPELGLVHSRRYEMFRESLDDFRYVTALRQAAERNGDGAVRRADTLIQDAIEDITTHPQDHERCEIWRIRIAERILTLQ